MKAGRPLLWFAAVLGLTAGCERPPRPAVVIVKEREELPALYLTEKSGKPVTAPGNKLMFVDPKTNELCWHAYECINPDCPGKKTGQPYLFPRVIDSGYFVKPDGTIGIDPEKSNAAPPYDGCPECLKIRNLARETPEEKARYGAFVRQHELPETARRRAQIEKELEKAMAPSPAK